MRILYSSCHSILEFDEVRLLTELGHQVFSMGAYGNAGKGHFMLPRPSIEGMEEFPEAFEMSRDNPRTNLPRELFDQFDAIIWMHQPESLNENWEKMKHKKVIFRSIGQNTSHVENTLRHMWYEGLSIVRMSKMEENIIGYVGANALIPFYKNQYEWINWNGDVARAMNMTQSLLARRQFCHYDSIMATMNGFPALVYGSGNEDLASLCGGELPYDLMRGALRDNRCFVYAGTWPSPYTLAFMEAMMTGIPMVCIGKKLAEEVLPEPDRVSYYEIPNIIRNGENGFISDNINELRDDVHQLLEDHALAKRISAAGRKTALELFEKEKIKKEWETFLNTL